MACPRRRGRQKACPRGSVVAMAMGTVGAVGGTAGLRALGAEKEECAPLTDVTLADPGSPFPLPGLGLVPVEPDTNSSSAPCERGVQKCVRRLGLSLSPWGRASPPAGGPLQRAAPSFRQEGPSSSPWQAAGLCLDPARRAGQSCGHQTSHCPPAAAFGLCSAGDGDDVQTVHGSGLC